jgi:hypothetical protein
MNTPFLPSPLRHTSPVRGWPGALLALTGLLFTPSAAAAEFVALGTGTDLLVRALAVSGSDVYAGGEFTTAGGVSASRIAKWNGSAWSALGSGVNGKVNSLAFSGTDLYVGGASPRPEVFRPIGSRNGMAPRGPPWAPAWTSPSSSCW